MTLVIIMILLLIFVPSVFRALFVVGATLALAIAGLTGIALMGIIISVLLLH